MLIDRYGLQLSTASAEARDAYVGGCDGVLSANHGAEEYLARCVSADPAFAVGHAALARAYFVVANVAEARKEAARARELAAGASPREQSHVNALCLAIEGRPVDALDATRRHLDTWPRDAMVLAPATGVFGLIGFSGRQGREPEQLALLDQLEPHLGGDWWFDCVRAFALEECGKLGEAQALVERSMALNPRNAHGAHIKAHVHYELGEDAAALAYLDEWMTSYPRHAVLHCHLSWHVAMFSLSLGQLDKAWQVYEAQVHPGGQKDEPASGRKDEPASGRKDEPASGQKDEPASGQKDEPASGSWGPAINTVTDAVSFLWRAELAGQSKRADLWAAVRDYALASFPKPGIAFVDVHSGIARAVAGGDVAGFVGELRERDAAGRLPAGSVVYRLVEGFAAYAEGNLKRAIATLEGALAETVRIGGSRAQRDLAEFTLLAAYLRDGRADAARALIARRVDRRPSVPVAGFAS